MSFLQQVIDTTKESNKKYKMERAEYERASNVLYDIAERKIKKTVLQRAKDGYTDATFDVINDLKLDIAGKWSIPELLFAIIFEDAPPVVSRLFYLSKSPFDGFVITTKAKDAGPASVFILDWAYEMLKPQPNPKLTPIKTQITPPANPLPLPPAKTQPVPITKPPTAPPVTRMPECDLSHELNNLLTALANVQQTPPPKPQMQTPPGAPMKPNNPVCRNIFPDTSIPAITDQQLIDYLNALHGELYPN